MTPCSEYELALSMMRLWGREAKNRARAYALDCWGKADSSAYKRWACVERVLEQAQDHAEPYAGTVSGVQRTRVVRGRRRWFELPLELVMPAIRRLGSCAMRGTGL